MQDHRAHDLHIEGTHARSPVRRLPSHRERLRHQIVKGLALLQTLPELESLLPQGLAGERSHVALQGGDLGDRLLEHLQLLALAEAEDFVNDLDHRSRLSVLTT